MDFIRFSEKECSTDFNMAKPDSHSFYELYFLTEGERRLISNNEAYILRAPIIALIPPFTPHLTEGGPYKRINIYASPKVLDFDEPFLSEAGVPCFFNIGDKERELLEGILRLAARSEVGFEYKRAFCLTALAIIKKHGKPVHVPDITRHETPSIVRVVNYINEHFTEEITLSELCLRFYYTKNTLCRQFKRHMNCTVKDYILLMKLNKAKTMLYETKMSIQEISDECGFSSSNYFSLIFTRKTGISPSEFRKTL